MKRYTDDDAIEYESGQSLDTDLGALYTEVEVARTRRDEIFLHFDQSVARLTGPYFRGIGRDSGISPENPDYEWFALMRSQIVAGKPAWFVSQRRADVGRVEAQAVRHGLDRWSVEHNLKRQLRKFFTDWAIRKCVAYIRRVPSAGSDLGVLDGPAMTPQLTRLSPRRFLCDPLAQDIDDTRWRAHETITPLPLLLKQAKAAPEDEGWRIDVIEKLKPGGDFKGLRPDRMRAEIDRREVVVIEMWIPEEDLEDPRYTPEQGYHGVTHTFACTTVISANKAERDGDGLVEIRDPQPFFGPRWGPYIVSGQDYVPDDVEPLSLFVATEANVRSFQRRARVISDAVDSYKMLALIFSQDETLASRIHSGRHRGVITTKKPLSKDSIHQLELGGITAQMATQYQWDSEKIDRLRGLTDAMRGNVTGVATATENALAQSGASARTSGLRDVWYEFVSDIGRSIAWYMVEDDQSIVTLPPEMADRFGTPQVLVGGSDGVRFEDLEIDIEPLSMEYKSSMQRRQEADANLQALTLIGPAVVQNPWIDWDGAMSRRGAAYGDPTMRELINYQLAGQVAGVMLGSQLVGAGQTASPPDSQPKLAKDAQRPQQPMGGKARAPGASGPPTRPKYPGSVSGNAARKSAKAALPGAA